MAKYKGIPMDVGGVSYIVPPVSLAFIEDNDSAIKSFTGAANDASQVTFALNMIHAAISRNHPEVTRSELREVVDVGNMAELIEAVMDVSGLKRKSLELGEAKADR